MHDRVFSHGRLIWEDDWDICLVVDACRWDLWQEVADGNWPTGGCGWSVGSASPEWYGQTFDPENLPDERIGVVTANPFASKPSDRMPEYLGEGTPIHRHDLEFVDYIFEDSWGCEVGGGYIDVTHPAAVTNRAFDAWTNHDLDRLVVHYMQPHIPFRAKPEWFAKRENLQHFGEPDLDAIEPQEDGGGNVEVWKEIRNGTRTREEVWEAYRDNLEWVLGDIDRLRTAVDADLLITSDHGNAIGEWGLWSHPPGFHTPQLRRVPWVHVEATQEAPFERVDGGLEVTEERDVEEQLEALGYR